MYALYSGARLNNELLNYFKLVCKQWCKCTKVSSLDYLLYHLGIYLKIRCKIGHLEFKLSIINVNYKTSPVFHIVTEVSYEKQSCWTLAVGQKILLACSIK
jgi:hypothetical protein